MIVPGPVHAPSSRVRPQDLLDTVRHWLAYLDADGLALIAAVIEKLLEGPHAPRQVREALVRTV